MCLDTIGFEIILIQEGQIIDMAGLSVAGVSISQIASTGFRIVRERPKLVIAWSAVQLAVALAQVMVLILLSGPAATRLMATLVTRPPNLAKATQDLEAMLPTMAILLPLSLICGAFFTAAFNRAVLAPDDDKFGYFRFGLAELQQFSLNLQMAMLFFVGSLLLAVIGNLIQSITHVPVQGPLLLAQVGGSIYIYVRLSLAAPQTFATGRINLAGSWTLTRGRVGPLLATYGLSAIFAALVFFLALLMTSAIVELVLGIGSAHDATPDLRSPYAYFTLETSLRLILTSAIMALALPIWGTPPSVIYQLMSAEAQPAR